MRSKKILFIGIFLVISFFIGSYIVRHLDSLGEIRFKPEYILMVVLVALLTRLIESLKLRFFMSEFDIKLTAVEAFGVAVIANYYNYLFTKAGLAASAMYMKKKHELGYASYVGVAGGNIALKVLVAAAVGAITIFMFAAGRSDFTPVLGVYILFFILAALFFFLPAKINSENAFYKKISRVLDGWHRLKRNHKLISVVMLFEFAILSLIALKYYFIFRMLGVPVLVSVCFILATVNVISHFVNIIPQGYGVKEVFIGLTSKVLGYGLDMGVLVALIDRVVMMSVAVVLGPIFSYLLFGKFYLKAVEDTQMGKGS